MKKNRRAVYPYLTILLIAIINWFMHSYISPKTSSSTTTPTPGKTSQTGQVQSASSEAALVLKVIDGDTIQISTGQKVRYIGIDTPETHDPKKAHQCFGTEASQKNKELVEGKHIRMVKDISETDRYGRLLRYVYVLKDSTPEAELFVNEYLVAEGYAYALRYPPDIKNDKHFHQLQTLAQNEHKGMWNSCPATELSK